LGKGDPIRVGEKGMCIVSGFKREKEWDQTESQMPRKFKPFWKMEGGRLLRRKKSE